MAENVLDELMERTSTLTLEEQLRLIAHLAERARASQPGTRPRRKWRDIVGLLPYPLAEEDAQAWVTRTRREGDESRET